MVLRVPTRWYVHAFPPQPALLTLMAPVLVGTAPLVMAGRASRHQAPCPPFCATVRQLPVPHLVGAPPYFRWQATAFAALFLLAQVLHRPRPLYAPQLSLLLAANKLREVTDPPLPGTDMPLLVVLTRLHLFVFCGLVPHPSRAL